MWSNIPETFAIKAAAKLAAKSYELETLDTWIVLTKRIYPEFTGSAVYRVIRIIDIDEDMKADDWRIV